MKLLSFFELTIGWQAMMMMMTPPPLTAFDDEQSQKEIAMSRPAPARVTYQVIGMMKTKSGAT